MIIIGITGNIGSGKSLVAKIFETMDCPVFHADTAGHKALHHPLVIKQIVELFGADILMEDGNINRRKLAALVFNDAGLLSQLNDIIHPAVRKDFSSWIEKQHAPVCLYEAAILFESGYNNELDKIICITSPTELRCKRVMLRDGISETEFYAREARQMEQDKKAALSDWVIHNDEEKPLLNRVMEVYHEIMEMTVA